MENLKEEIRKALAESRAAQQEARDLLVLQGEVIDLAEWVTLKEYVKRYNLNSINTLTNWIRRGVVPPENVRTVPELNNIRLVKAVPYREVA